MSVTRDPAPPPGERRLPGEQGRSSSDDAIEPAAIRASYRTQLSSGEDFVDPSTWAGSVPVAYGIAPRVRVGRSRWFNLLWLLPIGFVLLIVAVAAAKGLRNIRSVAAVHRPTSRHSRARRATAQTAGVAGLGRRAALLQPVPVDLHHPIGSADPHRPPAAVLDTSQHPGQGLVPHPEAGTGRPAVDREAGFDQPARPGRPAGAPALDRAGPMVAPGRRHPVAAERARVLRPAVHAPAQWRRVWCPRAGLCSRTRCRY